MPETVPKGVQLTADGRAVFRRPLSTIFGTLFGTTFSTLFCLLPLSLHAQSWTRDWPQSGDPVRVTSNTPPLKRAKLTFERQTNDTLVFVRGSGLSTSIALQDISRLEMPGIPRDEYGSRKAAMGKGALIGALSGGVIGYFMPRCKPDECGYFGPGFEGAFLTGVGVTAGGLVGGVTGWVVGRNSYKTWRTVHPKP